MEGLIKYYKSMGFKHVFESQKSSTELESGIYLISSVKELVNICMNKFKNNI